MSIFAAAILGGLLSSDVTAAFQSMVSRPIFCAPLFGLIFGDVEAGIRIGIIIELLWISVVPLGNAVPPDSTVVAVSAVYISALTRAEFGQGYIAFLILTLVPLGILFKRIDIYHRQKNSLLLHYLKARIGKDDFKAVNRVTYISFFVFVSKAFVFLIIIMRIGVTVLPSIYKYVPYSVRESLSFLLYILPAIGLGTMIQTMIFKKSPRRTDV